MRLTEDQKVEAVFFRLKKHKRKYLLVVTCAILAIFFFLRYYLLTYSSKSLFYVNSVGLSPSVDARSSEPQSSDDNFNRVLRMVNSSKLQNHLIKKFNLVKHYGFDSKNEFCYSQTTARLSRNITTTRTPYKAVAITVNDKYRYLAADIANEIVNYLDEDNKEFYITNLTDRLKISKAYLNDLEAHYQKNIGELNVLIKTINDAPLVTKNNELKWIGDEKMRVNNLTSDLGHATSELISAQKLCSIAVVEYTKSNLPSFTRISIATPSPVSLSFLAFIYSILSGCTISVIIVAYLYFQISNRHFFKVLITAEDPLVEKMLND